MGSGWPEATLHLRVALISMCLGYVLFLIGFSSRVWQVKDHQGSQKEFGLWGFLVHKHSRDWDVGIVDALENPLRLGSEAWYRATQAMECFGLICMTLALLVLILYFFVPSFKQRRILLGVLITTFASVVFIIIGVIIFGSKMGKLGYSVGWSMALAIVGAILAFIAGVMELLEYIR